MVVLYQKFGLTSIILLFKEILMLPLLMQRMFKEIIQVIKEEHKLKVHLQVLLVCHIKLQIVEI